jgi:hypothetical protein
MPQHDMCPICAKPFEDGDVTVGYRVWPSLLPRTAHFRCLMAPSNAEGGLNNPKGPPQKSKKTTGRPVEK